MRKKKVKTAPEQSQTVELTKAERDRIEAYKARVESTPGSDFWKSAGQDKDGRNIITNNRAKGDDHFFAGLWAATGAVDPDLGNMLLTQTSNATDQPFSDPAQHTNSLMAALCGIAPRNQLEGLLCAQMVSAHNQAMDCLRRANIPNQSFEGRRLNLTFADRFMRTFAVQVEALTRYRRAGTQKVTVEHIHVYPGGKAAVGVFNQASEGTGRGDDRGNEGTTSCVGAIEHHKEGVTLPLARNEEMWREVQADGETLSGAGHAEREM